MDEIKLVRRERISLLILCIFINITGKFCTSFFHLPLWLDTIGTCISAYFLGPIYAIVVGILNNVIFGFSVHAEFAYALTSVVAALGYSFSSKKGYIDTFTKSLISGFLVGVLVVLFNTPLTILIYKGGTGNFWGDGICALLASRGCSDLVATFFSNLILDIVDKQISVVASFLLIKLLRKNFLLSRGRSNKALLVTQVVVALLFTIALPIVATVYGDQIPTPEEIALDHQMASLKKQAEEAQLGEVILPEYPEDGFQGNPDTRVFNGSYLETVYDNTNGLMSSEANTIVQTPDGFLWIGSYSGLLRYDGYRFTYIHKENLAAIRALISDGEDRLWIGTNDSGLVGYSAGSFFSITKTDGLSSDTVRSLALTEDGTLYVGTAASLCKIDKVGLVKEIPAKINYVISLATIGNDVFGVTYGGELFALRGDTLLDSLSDSADIYTSVTVAGNEIWAGTYNGKVKKYVLKNDKLVEEQIVSAPNFGNIDSLYCDLENRIWVGGTNAFGYLDENRQLQTRSYENFAGAINGFYQDYSGNIWVASGRYGVMELSRNRFKNILQVAGEEERTANSVLLDDELIYVGSDNGLVILTKDNYEVVENELTETLSGTRIRNIMKDSENNLWFATYGEQGLYCVHEDGTTRSYTNNTDATTGTRFRCSYEMSDGTIVVGAVDGVNVIRGGEVVETYTEEDGLQNTQILTITEGPSGEIVVGTDGEGIYVIDQGKVVKNITRNDGLTSNIIMRMIPCDGGFIVVTSNSLCFMKGDLSENSCRALTHFPFYNNFDVKIYGKTAYVLSSAGLYITDVEALIADVPDQYTLVGYNEGLVNSLVSNSWNVITDDGELYICTNGGVSYMEPSTNVENEKIYHFGVSEIYGNKEEIYSYKGVYQIPSEVTEVQICPSVRNFSKSGLRAVCYVEGIQKDVEPVAIKDLEPVTITNMAGGVYQVWVKLIAEENLETIASKCIMVYKAPHLWEYRWFIAYMAIMLLWVAFSLIWSGIMIRVESRRKQEFDSFRVQAKNEFMTSMSHEILTPVNAIIGMNALILRENENHRIEGYANNIAVNCDVLLGILRGVLDYSSIEDGKISFTNRIYSLPVLVDDVVDMTRERAKQKGLEITIEVAEDIPEELEGDTGRIKQILGNLVGNAVKYTKQGFINIKVWTIPYNDFKLERTIADSKLEYREDGFLETCSEVVCISVKDTGIGIKEKDKDKLFESFSNREAKKSDAVKGTGLGLAITKGIANMMGGDIKVESEYGVGSTFTVRIPQRVFNDAANSEEEKGLSMTAKEAAFAAPTARVLCVDDNETNLTILKGLLKRVQIVPVLARSGEECLKETNKERFDLIIMDHLMPEMDGIETMKLIRDDKRNSNKDTPIIVSTANALPGMREEYLGDGFDEFLGKPVNADVLEQMLMRFLPKNRQQVSRQNNKPSIAAVQEKTRQDVLIDKNIGIGYSGGDEQVYQEILASYVKQSEKYLMDLPLAKMDKDWSTYAVEAHAMKSTSKTIGALSLSEFALEMENACKTENAKFVESKHDEFLALFRQVIEAAVEYLPKKTVAQDRTVVSEEEYKAKVEKLAQNLYNYDMTAAREIFDVLSKITTENDYSKDLEKNYSIIEDAIKNYDYAAAEEMVNSFIKGK